jgi:Protein of unknown function, DUF417
MDTANQFLPKEETLVRTLMRATSGTPLEAVGIHVSRYGLVLTLLLIGALKFTVGEARGIQPLVANSPANVLALSNLQPSGRFQPNRSDRNRRCPAHRRAAAFGEALFHWQPWGRHHIRVDSEFSLVDTWSVPVLTRTSLVGGCWPIPHQGSSSSGRIDLDRRRGAVGRLGFPSAVVKPLGVT